MVYGPADPQWDRIRQLHQKDAMSFTDALLSSPSTVLGVVLVLILLYMILGHGSDHGPPGPRPVPLVGNLLQLDMKKPHKTLIEFSKQYGSVFTVWLGSKKVVVLAGFKTVKEALVDHAEVFGDRDLPPIAKDPLLNESHGVVWSNNEEWKELRRFSLMNLKDFGMGRRVCEDKITEESQYLCDVLKNFKGKPFDTSEPVNHAVCNIICSLVYGSRFEYNDPTFVKLVKSEKRNLELYGSPSMQIYNLFPWLGRFLPERNEILKLKAESKKENHRFFKTLKETLNPTTCRGFVDSYLLRQEKEKAVPNTPFNDANLLTTVRQLFAAGTETTATTLRWILLLMAKYPQIQDQVREEISRVIGARQVQTEDRKELPFTDAVIHETQRLGNVVPMAIPHKTSEDVTFQGHFLSKGTTVYPLLSSVLYDESQWDKPHSFYPAHFLDKDGKFIKRDAFMPFSAGRRACLGESLARMELFIFFVTLIQRFSFMAPPGVTEEQLDLTPITHLTQSPVPHKLCAVLCQ